MAKKSKRSEVKYLDMYNYIQQYGRYDEDHILRKYPLLKKGQLPNLRANLYKQVLRSLRDIHKESYLEIKAREQFDFAKVLYSKGQYVASLEMLGKVKKLADRTNKLPLKYLALSFEKHIEAQHVTGSMSSKAVSLSDTSSHILDSLSVTNQLSNLSLLLYGRYLQLGNVRTKSERDRLKQFFNDNLPNVEGIELDFYQRLYLIQSYLWYYNITQNFAKYFQYAQRWVNLFEANPEMQKIDTAIYIKGLHNVLNALYLSDKPAKFEIALEKFNKLEDRIGYDLSINEKTQLELFKNIHNLNLVFFRSSYREALPVANSLEITLDVNPNIWDLNRRMVFRYKLACVYFGADELEKCIDNLNKITNSYIPQFKEDIQCFARILKLIAHFDMGDEDLVSYDVRSVYRFLLKMKEMQAPQREILRFIRKTPVIAPTDIIQEFRKLRDILHPLEQDMLERRPFLYLDIISWLDSKILGISMIEAITRRKAS